MSAMIIDAYHDGKAADAHADTWGHLQPSAGDHPGTIVASNSEYADQGYSIVATSFPTLDDSPWLYEALNEYTSQLTDRAPGIYEWSGSVRVFKNGHLRFVGTWRQMSLFPGRLPAVKKRRHWGNFATGRKAPAAMMESDHDYMENNRDAVVRFLDTMNARRTP